jgi:hypothetical protein
MTRCRNSPITRPSLAPPMRFAASGAFACPAQSTPPHSRGPHLLLDGCATRTSEHPRPAEDMAPHRGFRAAAGRADAVPSLAAVQSLLPPPKYVVVPPIRVRSIGVDGFGTLSSMTDSAPGLETPRCRVIPRSLLLSARCSRRVAAVPWGARQIFRAGSRYISFLRYSAKLQSPSDYSTPLGCKLSLNATGAALSATDPVL